MKIPVQIFSTIMLDNAVPVSVVSQSVEEDEMGDISNTATVTNSKGELIKITFATRYTVEKVKE